VMSADTPPRPCANTSRCAQGPAQRGAAVTASPSPDLEATSPPPHLTDRSAGRRPNRATWCSWPWAKPKARRQDGRRRRPFPDLLAGTPQAPVVLTYAKVLSETRRRAPRASARRPSSARWPLGRRRIRVYQETFGRASDLAGDPVRPAKRQRRANTSTAAPSRAGAAGKPQEARRPGLLRPRPHRRAHRAITPTVAGTAPESAQGRLGAAAT
jgi:hypothetical protein